MKKFDFNMSKIHNLTTKLCFLVKKNKRNCQELSSLIFFFFLKVLFCFSSSVSSFLFASQLSIHFDSPPPRAAAEAGCCRGGGLWGCSSSRSCVLCFVESVVGAAALRFCIVFLMISILFSLTVGVLTGRKPVENWQTAIWRREESARRWNRSECRMYESLSAGGGGCRQRWWQSCCYVIKRTFMCFTAPFMTAASRSVRNDTPARWTWNWSSSAAPDPAAPYPVA